MSRALAFPITCPDCGSPVDMVTGSKPDLLRVSAMVQCAVCRAEIHVVVTATVTHRPKYRPVYGTGFNMPRKSRAKAAV